MSARASSRAARGAVRVAISGCGAVTELYYAPTLDGLARQGRVEVVALADPDRRRCDLLAARFPRAGAFTELAAALDTRPQLLIVASPPRFHAQQAIAALAAGVDVLCEKPLAISPAEVQRMREAEIASGRLLAVAMVRRQMPAAHLVRSMVARELLGPLDDFEVFEGGPFRWPVHASGYFDARTGTGGVLLDIGAHVLDLLVWWLGVPAAVVAEDDAMGGIEANVRLALECGGVPGVLRLSRDWERPNHVTIRGARGTLRWNPEEIDRIHVSLGSDAPLELRAAAGGSTTFLDCFNAQLSAVLDALDGNTAGVVRAAELLPSIEVIDAAYRQRSLMEMPWLSAREREAAALAQRPLGAQS